MKKLLLIVFSLFYLITNAQNPKITEQKLENLKAFNKLYGYVRYFYPGDEVQNVDWDRFLIYGTKESLRCQNEAELKETLEKLFLPMAPAIKIYRSTENSIPDWNKIHPGNKKDLKLVSWQYRGVMTGDLYRPFRQQTPYLACRTNRNFLFRLTNHQNFASFSRKIDVRNYSAKRIKYSGRIKAESYYATIFPFLKELKTDKKAGLFENSRKESVSLNTWVEFSLEGDLAVNAESLIIGAYQYGEGTTGIDDLKLSYLENGEWKIIYQYNFENERTGNKCSEFTKHLGKKSSYSNNNELKIVDGNTDNKYLQMIADFSESVIKKKNFFIYKTETDPNKHVIKQLNSDLNCFIPLCLYADKNNTFPKADAVINQQLGLCLQTLEKPDYSFENVYIRIASIIQIWNIFQHFHPHRKTSFPDWDKDFESFIKDAENDKGLPDFELTLERLISKIKDAHGVVSGSFNSNLNYYYGIQFEALNGKYIINKSTREEIKKGNELISLNGKRMRQLRDSVRPLSSAATEEYAETVICHRLFSFPENSNFKAEIKDSTGTITEYDLTATNYIWEDYNKKQESFRKIEDSILYFNLSEISYKKIRKHRKEMDNSKAVIFDLRGYPLNDTWHLLMDLIKVKDTCEWMFIPLLDKPDMECDTFRALGWELPKTKDPLKCKVIFITDHRAVSYAESILGIIEHYNLGIIVGHPTAGTNGNVNPFSIRGPFYISWTGMEVRKLDGSRHYGVGVLPDVYVNKSIQGIKEGRDEFLEKAIEIANN